MFVKSVSGFVITAALMMALTQARPSYVLPATTYAQLEYTPTVVGHELHSLPTAISHQSQTIVHEKRPYLRPIVEHTPILKSYTPLLKSYEYTPFVKTYTPSGEYPLTYTPLSYTGLYDDHHHRRWNSGFDPSHSSIYAGFNGWPWK